MKSLNGFLQYLDNAGLNRSNLKIVYDFQESGSPILNKAPNYSGLYGGVLSGNPTTYFHGSGTGYCQSDMVSISGQAYSTNFTQFFHISRQQSANDNFYSSLGEGAVATSGYSISTNDAGKLLFQCKTCTGPQSITSDFSLNQDSHFAVSKQGDVVNLYQYTPGTDILDSYSDTVNDSEIFTSSYADLFFANTAPIGFLKDYFSGYIFDYLYFDVGLSPTQIKSVVSGLHSDFTVVSTGACGFISGSIFIMPTGASYTTTTTIPASASLNRNGIVLLRYTPINSTIVIDYGTGVSDGTWNKSANFNNLDDDFYLQNFTTRAPIIYLNGIRNLSGISQITGTFCGTGRSFSQDFQLSGLNRIVDAGKFGANDTIIYDIPEKHSWQNLYSGGQAFNIGIYAGSGKSVFLNGQLLTSGNDYSVSGSTLTLEASITSGDMICLDYYAPGYSVIGEIYSTGFFYTSGAFAQNTSRVFLNGQRMKLNTDYLEIISGTSLLGCPINQPSNTVVEITDMTVWNI